MIEQIEKYNVRLYRFLNILPPVLKNIFLLKIEEIYSKESSKTYFDARKLLLENYLKYRLYLCGYKNNFINLREFGIWNYFFSKKDKSEIKPYVFEISNDSNDYKKDLFFNTLKEFLCKRTINVVIPCPVTDRFVEMRLQTYLNNKDLIDKTVLKKLGMTNYESLIKIRIA